MHRSHVEYALTLLARTAGGSDERARMAAQTLSRWRETDPAHEAAFQEAQQRWQSMDRMRAGLRALVPAPVIKTSRPRVWRMTLSGGALASLALACAGWYYMVPLSDQVYTTPVAQTGRYALDDGSTLELNAASSVRIQYYRQRREATLLAGEARFHVAPAPTRPFRVTGGGLQATVLGTVFVVGQRDPGAQVQVEEGVVRVDAQRPWWQPNVAGPVLRAGQQVRSDGLTLDAPQTLPDTQAAAWLRGLAVFDNTTLADALQQVQPWSSVPLQLTDAQAGQARITGTFHLNDLSGLLALLPHIAPVSVTRSPNAVVIGSERRAVPAISK